MLTSEAQAVIKGPTLGDHLDSVMSLSGGNWVGLFSSKPRERLRGVNVKHVFQSPPVRHTVLTDVQLTNLFAAFSSHSHGDYHHLTMTWGDLLTCEVEQRWDGEEIEKKTAQGAEAHRTLRKKI